MKLYVQWTNAKALPAMYLPAPLHISTYFPQYLTVLSNLEWPRGS